MTSPRTIAIAIAASMVLVLLIPDEEDQPAILRTSEIWLDGASFNQTTNGLLSEVIQAPRDFTSLSIAWKASQGTEMDHRVSGDGKTWSDWLPLPEDAHDPGSGVERFGALQFYPKRARFVQISATGGLHPRIDGVHAVFISPSSNTSPEPTFSAASVDDPVPQPPIVSRSDWGCPDGQDSRWEPVATDPDFFIIHHSAGSNTSNHWSATVQAIWSFHTITRGWGDIGYNFLIDPDGVIYEGRAGGNSIGAHFSCTNGGTTGVCMIGDFTAEEPTTAALDSLAKLLAWKAETESIDPLAQAYHSQSDLTLNTISGHRDANGGTEGCASGTVCPGAMLYPLLPGIRTSVANIIATGTANPILLELTNASFSPSSIQSASNTTVSFQLLANQSFNASFELALIDASGAEHALPNFNSEINSGTQSKNRGLVIPSGIPPGGYDLRVRILSSSKSLTDQTFPNELTIVEPSFADWASTEIADSNQRAAEADPDHDGLSNLLEYALNLTPTSPDPSPVEFLWVDAENQRYPAVEFTQRDNPSLSVALEVDEGAGNWTGTGVTVSDTPVPGGRQKIVRSHAPATQRRQFLRLRVTEN